MILKKLEINGFKSFGKKVELEFDTPITAIVGPNGSGKSNVSEAIRWVLGEQSMKSLRGKRGEDLIFHGSGSAAQLGKARVSIAFDNAVQTFPVDFSELVISREVYRDGVNEYRVNDSQVRLKDIIELMSNVGVGGSGHHIISQGEADRVLYASPKDRKNMIEDALGLRIYHIKQQEAERKLMSTAENMREVSMLRREIQPHMRFLAGEAKKIESSQKMREELKELLTIYINRERISLDSLRYLFESREEPLKNNLAEAEQEASMLRTSLSEKRSIAESSMPKEVMHAKEQLVALDAARRDMEREIGRIEGQLAVLNRRETPPKEAPVWPAKKVETELRALLSIIDTAATFHTIEMIQGKLSELKTRITQFLADGKTSKTTEYTHAEQEKLEEVRKQFLDRLWQNEEEKNKFLAITQAWEKLRHDSQAGLWEYQKRLQTTEERIYALKDNMRSLEMERERLRMRTDEFQHEQEEAELFFGSIPDSTNESWQDEDRLNAYQKILRLRIRLEEAGGVNPQILQEYADVQQRDLFLAKELEDLQKSETSLKELQEQLEKELEQSFSAGIRNINTKFDELFQTMFGGGNAKLTLVRLEKREDISLGAPGAKLPANEEYGVEISVDIPRKRVKNLDMLSGGERALTSIALLFAMSFVNPPPFLILDETDAALDEANSQRYGAMLRNLSDKTQLIVITHNRQTMKEAGVLYGVTMGTDGVSRLLSIKFDEAKEVSEKKDMP